MTAPARAEQIKAIHTLKARAGLTDDDYRAALSQRYGVTSSTAMSMAQAVNFIDHLREFQPARSRSAPRVKGAMDLRGPFAAKLRALWIAGYDCGVVRDRTDKALVAFLERQTGLSHPAFLNEPKDARRVVEALKKWLAREAGIDWTVQPSEDAAIVQRLAVIKAQKKILAHGGLDVSETFTCADLSPDALDRRRASLGQCIRRMKAAVT